MWTLITFSCYLLFSFSCICYYLTPTTALVVQGKLGRVGSHGDVVAVRAAVEAERAGVGEHHAREDRLGARGAQQHAGARDDGEHGGGAHGWSLSARTRKKEKTRKKRKREKRKKKEKKVE